MALFVSVAIPACGGGVPYAPTPSYVRGSETESTTVDAGASFCKDFTNAKAGAVNAVVTPQSLRLTVAAGTCSAPGQTLAEKNGEVSVDAPAGANHVGVANPSDQVVSFTLTITYWH